MEFELAAAALLGAGERHGRWLEGPARQGKEPRPLYRRHASFLVTDGRMGAPRRARGRTTPVGPRVAARVQRREARGVLGMRTVLGKERPGRACPQARTGTEATARARPGADVAQRGTAQTCRTGNV
jgi:hypothetical protein